MPAFYMDVDVALSEVPVNIMPLVDNDDFITIETDVNYNAAGLILIWHFITTAGVYSQPAVTPTDTGGNYDWIEQGNGLFTIEIPASGGVSINNDTEGFGWFTGIATGILPWRGPVIGFRKASMNNIMVDNGTLQDNLQAMFDGNGYAGGTTPIQVDVTKVHGSALSETAGGYLAAGIVKQYDIAKPVFTSESLNQTADVKTVTDIISASKISSSMDAMSDIDFSSTMKTSLNASTPISVGKVTGNVDGSVASVAGNVSGSVASVAGNVSGSVASVSGAVNSVTNAVNINSNADITSILEDTGTTLDTLIKDVPTVAEFEARSLLSADYVVVSDTIAKVTDVVNDVGITQVGADKVWFSISRTLTSFGTLISDIWSNATRTLSGFGTLVADIWANITRSLTDKANFTISGTKTTLDSLSGSDGDTIKTLSDQLDNISTSISNLNDISASEVLAKIQTAIENNDLDHFIKVAAGVNKATIGSFLDQIMNKDATQTFDKTTGSLQAISDSLLSKSLIDGLYTAAVTLKRIHALVSGNGSTRSGDEITFKDADGNNYLKQTIEDSETTTENI